MDNEKLIGTLRVNLSELKKDFSQAEAIFKNFSKVKVGEIDVSTGKESITVLRQLEEEFKKLKTASGNSFDTSIFKNMEKALRDLGVEYGTVIQKVTEYSKTNKDTGELEVWKKKTNAITETGHAIETVEKQLKDGSKSISESLVIDNTAKDRIKAYSDAIAKVNEQYQKMRADETLNVEGLEKLKAELNGVATTYQLSAAEAAKLYSMQATYNSKIASINNPKTTTADTGNINAYKQELAQLQNQHNEFAIINKLDASTLTDLNSKLDTLRGKYKLTETELKPLITTQKQYTTELNNLAIAEAKEEEEKKKANGANTNQYLDSYKSKLGSIKQEYLSLNSVESARVTDLNNLANKTNALAASEKLEGEALIQATTQSNKYTTESLRLQASIDSEVTKRAEAANKIVLSNEKQSLSTLAMYTEETAALTKYDQMSRTLNAASGEAGLAMSSSNSGASIMDRFKVSAVYTAAATSIYMVRQGLVDLIQTNRDYESSLVDLGRILGDTSEAELKAFGETQIAEAKKYGLALKDIQDTYTSLAAAGVQKGDLKSMANTVELGLNTSNISSGAEMTDLLTTSMKQLGIEMSKSESVLDGWNYLADKSVATTSDYAQAISKAGASSKAIGVDINELNGIVSVLSNATGMTGTAAGDAIKSVETRLLRPDALKTLKEYGIDVMDSGNKFKSFGDIIKETSTVLDKFGDNTTQSNDILDALGGTMRKNTVNILANNYDQVDSYAKMSKVDSVGYSAKKSAAEMGTLDKKIQQFNATVKELYIGAGSSGLLGQLKGIVEFGTAMLGAASKVSGLILVLAEVAIATKVFSGSLKLITGSNLTQSLDRMNKSFSLFGKGFNIGGATMATKSYEAASKSLEAQILAGNITAKESGVILAGVGEKLGIAATSTNTMSAAQGVLDARLVAGKEVQRLLNIEVAAGTLSQQGYKAELLQQMFTQEELLAQKEAGLITEYEYNLAMTRRIALEESTAAAVLAGTTTQEEANVILNQKILTQEQYNIVLAQTTTEMNTAIVSDRGKAASDEALNMSQKSVAASALIMNLAIGGGVIAVTLIISAIMKHVQAQKDLAQNITSANDALKTESDGINTSLSDYAELANKTKLTSDEKDRLTKATQNLINTVPGSSKVINDETLSLKEQTAELTKLAAAKEMVAINKDIKDNVQDNYDNKQKDASYYQNMVTKTESIASGRGATYETAVADYKTAPINRGETLTDDQAGVGVLKDANTQLVSYKSKLNEAQGALLGMNAALTSYTTKNAQQNGVNQNSITLLNKQIDAMEKKGASFNDITQYSNSSIVNLQKLADIDPYKAFTASMDKYNSKSTHTDAEIKAQAKSMDVYQEAAKKLHLPADEIALFTTLLTGEKNALNGTITSTKAAEVTFKDYATSMTNMTGAVSTAKTALADINTTISQVNKGHVFSADEITDLTTKYPELTSAVKTTTGGYTIEASALETLRTASIKTATDSMQVEITSAQQVVDSTLTRLKSYGVEIKGIKDLADAKAAANNITVDSTLTTFQKSSTSSGDDIHDTKGAAIATASKLKVAQQAANKAAIDKDVKAYGVAIANVDKLKASLATLTSTLNDNTLGVTSNTTSTEANTAAKEADTKATEALTAAQVALSKETANATATNKTYDDSMQTLSDTMKKQDNQLNTLNKDGADYRKGLLAKAKLIQNEIDLTNKNIKVNEANAKSLAASGVAVDKANSAKAIADANSTNASNAAAATTTSSDASGFSSVVPTKYRGVINAAAKKYGVSANVIAGMLLTENSFKASGTSPAGAQGIAQFIPSTARAYGVDVNDTTSSINGMAHYMADLIKQKGNVNDAIRGYNGSGPTTYTYLNTVKANMAKTGGNSTASSGTSSTGSYDTVSPAYTAPTDSGADSLLSKVASEKSSLIDLQQQLSEINYEIFQSSSAEFDDKISLITTKLTTLKSTLEDTNNTDAQKVKINSDIEAQMRAELKLENSKSTYIATELKSNKYNQAQKTAMNVTLQETLATQKDITNQIQTQMYVKVTDKVATFDQKISTASDRSSQYQKEIDMIGGKTTPELSVKDKNYQAQAESDKIVIKQKLAISDQQYAQTLLDKKSIADRVAYLKQEISSGKYTAGQVKEMNAEVHKTLTQIIDNGKELQDEENAKEALIQLEKDKKLAVLQNTPALDDLEIKSKDITTKGSNLLESDYTGKVLNQTDVVQNLTDKLGVLTKSYADLNTEINADGKITKDEQTILDDVVSKVKDTTQAKIDAIAQLETIKVTGNIKVMTDSVKSLTDAYTELQNKESLLQKWKPEDYTNIGSLQTSMLANTQAQYDLSLSQSASLLKLRDSVDVGTVSWTSYNDQLNTVNATTESSISSMADEAKALLTTSLNAADSAAQTTIFGSSTGSADAQNAIDAQKTYNSTYISGQQEALEISERRTKVEADIRNATTDANKSSLQSELNKLDVLGQQSVLKQTDLDKYDKELAVTEAQIALQNAQNNKSEKLDVKNADGTWGTQYVADQTTIDTATTALQQAQVDLITWQQTTDLDAQQTDLDNKNKYYAALQQITTNAENGVYKTQEELQTALDKLNAQYSASGITLATNFSDITNAYSTYTNSMIELTNEMASAVENTTNTLANAVELLATAMGKLATATTGSTTGTNKGTTTTSSGDTVTKNSNGTVTVTNASGNSSYTVVTGSIYDPTSTNYRGYANGTISAEAGLAKVNELGTEMRVLDNGDGITTASITSNINTLGSLAPSLISSIELMTSTQSQDYGELVTYLPNALTSIASIMDKINLTNINNSETPIIHNTYTYGDLSFPDVTSSDEILNAIKSLRSSVVQKSL